MPFVPATAKTALRAKLDTGLGTAVDAEGGNKRQALVDAICDWLGTDVLPTLTVATTVATTVVGACSTGPLTGTGTGTGTGTVS
jgi:hypothetical protein